MKIGFDAKRVFHNATGLGNYSRDLISILARNYTDNEYVLYNTKPKKIDRLQPFVNVTEVLPKSKFWKKFSSLWRQKAIVRQIVNDEIDLYHGLSGEIPIGLSKTATKTVVTIHDLIFMRYPELYSFFDRKIHFYKFKYAARNADKVIAISEQTKKDIITYLKTDASKIEVVYQGCHNAFKEPYSSEEKTSLRQKYNLPDSFILNVGTIEERKNVLSAIKAIKNIETTLVIVGRKTKYYHEVISYITENELKNKVVFLEGMSLKELATLYQMAEAFVYPSVFEGFGIPIIEALYSKTPVITTKGEVFPEAGGPDSLYVKKDNITEFESAIKKVLENHEVRQNMIEEGFKFVQKFDNKLIGNNIMNIYKDLLNE